MIRGAFCTIITKNYAHYAVRLFQSLQAHAIGTSPIFYVFLVDEISEPEVLLLQDFGGPGFEVVLPKDLLSHSKMAQDTFATYAAQKDSMLRWALKPVAMKYVLESKGADACYFLDPDLCFFSDYGFLWDYFEHSNIVLSPHWREIDPSKTDSTAEISLNYKHGVFNGGFVGASPKALDFLDWWSASCVALPRFENRGSLFVDQKFLDVVPTYFEGVHILKHKGCNISEWNEKMVVREKLEDRIVLNLAYDLVFAHFANSYELAIQAGRDGILGDLYLGWKQSLEEVKQSMLGRGLDGLWVRNSEVKSELTPLLRAKKWVYYQAKKIVDRAEGNNK
jgi:hypothetical protein